MEELALGHRGARVRALHQWLRRSGFEVALVERQAEWFGPSTEGSLIELQVHLRLPSTGVLPREHEAAIKAHAESRPLPNDYRVHGVVRRRDGSPVRGATITAEDVDLFSAQRLGTAHSDERGEYDVRFSRTAFARAERLAPDVRVRVSTASDAEIVSSIVFNAATSVAIDVVVGGGEYAGPSEWAALLAAVTPLLDGHSIDELHADQIDFLVGEIDFPRDRVSDFVAAAQLSVAARALGAPLSAEVFFAVLRQRAPADLTALGLMDDRRVTAALTSALGSAVPDHEQAWVDRALVAWKTLREKVAATSSVATLGAVAGLSTDQASRIAARFVETRGQLDEFWQTIANDAEIAPAVPTLKRLSRLSTFARGHLPMVRLLEARYQRAQATSLGALLGAIDDPTWNALAQESGAPSGTTIADYAARISATVEARFPTHVVGRYLAAARIDDAPAVIALLATHADVHSVLEEPITAWLDGGDTPPAAVIDSAARVQRLYKIAGRAQHVGALLALPHRSAADIVRTGRGGFIALLPTIDSATANDIYNRALRQHESAVWLWSRYDDHVNPALGRALPTPIALPDRPRIPNFRQTFGSLTFCGCEECRSIYSPAAYLTDLLHFTATANITPDFNAIDYLYWDNPDLNGESDRLARRHDLGFIELTCENTNRVLPTIDLVNELLEYVAYGPARLAAAGKSLVPKYQTTRSGDDLLLDPEHTLDAVYNDVLATAPYPWALPFELGVIKGRLFLAQLGIERRALLDLFAAAEEDRAVEELTLVPGDLAWLEATLATPALYGLSATQNFVDPTDITKTITGGTWLTYLYYAKYFLLRTGLTQEEFLAILDARFVAALGGLTLKWPDQDCNLDRATVTGLDEKKLQALHNFVRLLRRSGLSIRALDTFCAAFATDAIFSKDTIGALGRWLRVARRLGVTPQDALTLWTTLDTKGGIDNTPSQYTQIFLGPRVPASQRATFALSADATDLATTGVLSEHAATVAAAIGITVDEVTQLAPGSTLNLATLSRIYGAALLCRGLSLSVADFGVLYKLIAPPTATDLDPFSLAGIEPFLDRIALLGASGLSAADVDYLLRHHPEAPAGLAPVVATTQTLLTEIRDGLVLIAKNLGDQGANVAPPDDPTHARLASALAALLNPSDAAALLVLVDHAPALLDQAAATALLARLVKALGTPDVDNLNAQLVSSGSLTDVGQRAALVFEAIAAASRTTLVVGKLAAALALDSTLVADLLTWDPNAAVAYRLTATTFVSTDTVDNAGDYTSWWTSHVWLSKVALLISRLSLTPDDVRAWHSLQVSPTNWLALSKLPTTAAPSADDAHAMFESLCSALRVTRLRTWVKSGQTPLVRFVATTMTTTVDFSKDLGVMVGADVADSANALAPLSFTDGDWLARLRTLVDLASRTGVSPSTLASWSKSTLTVEQSNQIRNACKARVAADAWTSIARPLQNRLREAQRDALLAYICAHRHTTPEALAGFLLIDVEMSACQLTSRIRQALNSVQLFVQRIELGTELRGPAATPTALFLSDESAKQWREWMSTYARWRAARMVFLYPENYLDLSLRDDKTPIYVDFEKALTQGDITADVVEDAYTTYLTKLEQVAQLEVLALCEQPADGEVPKQLHVFARTRGTPNLYFYRTLVSSASWTPWEKLDLDISGDHLVPVVYDHTLYLFWVIFHDKQVPIDYSTLKAPNKKQNEQPHFFELELAYSERKSGKWTAKRVGRQKLKTMAFQSASALALAETDFTFHAATVSEIWDGVGKPDGLNAYQDDLCILCRQVKSAVDATPPEKGKKKPKHPKSTTPIGWWILPVCGGVWPTSDVLTTWHGTADLSLAPTPTVESGTLYLCHKAGATLTALVGVGVGMVDDDELFGSTPEPYSLARTTAVESATALFAEPPLLFQDARQSYLLLNNHSNDRYLPGFIDVEDPSSILNPTAPTWPAGADSNTSVGSVFAVSFFHRYACDFIQSIHKGGLDALFDPSNQSLAEAEGAFESRYTPEEALAKPYPQLRVEFGRGDAYSIYNWELFLWGPLRIAQRFAEANRFEEALAWYHRVYDPRDQNVAISPNDQWQFFPFRNRQDFELVDLLALLDYKGTDPSLSVARVQMVAAVHQWREHPFEPFLLGRHRQSAFMRMIAVDYIELLIAYGDSLFGEDTIESINIATQLYLWAKTLLGPRPEQHPARGQIPAQSFEDLRAKPLDTFSNALVSLENFIPTAPPTPPKVPIPIGLSFYFCVPPNDKLGTLWDTVDDRLWKIRHCRNLKGVERQLALFDGINEELLGAGLDVTALGGDALTPLPIYRFPVLLQKALEVAGELRAFGNALLSVIEKRDAEALARLRQRNERDLLDAVRKVKARQLDEATTNVTALQRGRDIAQARSDYFGSREFMNEAEKASIALNARNLMLTEAAIMHDLAASILSWIPNFQLGVQGAAATPTLTSTFGGSNFASALSSAGGALRGFGGLFANIASMAATMGSYQRRADEWEFQQEQADRELAQIEQQLLAANIRADIATQELANHDLQAEQARAIDDFLHNKFSSAELYDRMVKTLTNLHGRLRIVALDLSSRAQNSYRWERVDDRATFLRPSRVVGLQASLTAGDELIADLREMEAAYLDSNRRELELTRHISLAADFPDELEKLLATGQCDVILTEDYFDGQIGGIYMRRIKSAALTVACTVGPYEPVNVGLTLLSSKVRRDASRSATSAEYEEKPPSATQPPDSRFRYDFAPIGPMITSSAVNDSGMFEGTNFRDERLLWLEGAGAIGTYRIEIDRERTEVDLNTISDVTLHLRYTARDGGATMKKAAAKPAPERIAFFTARADFADAWELFVSTTGTTRKIALTLDAARFSARPGSTLTIETISIFWKTTAPTVAPAFTLTTPSGLSPSGNTVNKTPINAKALTVNEGLGNYVVTINSADVPDDLGILITYKK